MAKENNRESSDPYYDLIDDFDLIVSSFQSQYGLRLSKELETMKWDEFRDLLVGIGPDTPLGRIVSIRAEDNKDILKNYSPEHMRIRNEWRARNAKAMPQDQVDDYLEAMKQAFIKLAGGGKD